MAALNTDLSTIIEATLPPTPAILRALFSMQDSHYRSLKEQWRNIGVRYHHLTLSARSYVPFYEHERAIIDRVHHNFNPTEQYIQTVPTPPCDLPGIISVLLEARSLLPADDDADVSIENIRAAHALLNNVQSRLGQIQGIYDRYERVVDVLLLQPHAVRMFKDLVSSEGREIYRRRLRWALTLPEIKRQIVGKDVVTQNKVLVDFFARFWRTEENEGMQRLRATGFRHRRQMVQFGQQPLQLLQQRPQQQHQPAPQGGT